MSKKFVVYLSSTLDDLKPERAAAIEAISHSAVVSDSYRVSEQKSVELCVADVKACHLYVGILGLRYGWIPAQADGGTGETSITELEYEACLGPGGPDGRTEDIPRLMFIRASADDLPHTFIDGWNEQPTAQKIRAFHKRAGLDHTPFLFRNLDQLRAAIQAAVRDKEQAFQSEESRKTLRGNRGRIFGGTPAPKGLLAPVQVGCVPGTDGTQHAALASNGPNIIPFGLSPDDPAYLATLDKGLAGAQIGAILLTAASLPRLVRDDRPQMVAAAIHMLRERTGHALLLCEGIDPAQLPAEWAAADCIHVPDGSLGGANASKNIAALYEQIRAIDGRLTSEPRFALPYLVIAPTLTEAQKMASQPQEAFAEFGKSKTHRKKEFDHIKQASRQRHSTWPSGTYGDDRHHWKCFGEGSLSAEDIVRKSIKRINNAGEGSREMRLLQWAHLIPRRYSFDEYVNDRWGSRQLIEELRNGASLIVIDEVALLDPKLRAHADALLSGTRSAVVAISPCDPAHTGIEELLGEFSYLRVGTLVSRFTNDLDPRCELAVNSINRVERWLSATLPEMVASVSELQPVPEFLRGAQAYMER
ncbi:MAG: DUF4062 domain-containing protein [Pseudomarimonas sp.]